MKRTKTKWSVVKKTPKKRPVPRAGLHRPRNGGEWTEPRFKQFVINALRGARWGPKYRCIFDAFRMKGPDPVTGRPCHLHECSMCHELVSKKNIQADHIVPVMGPEGFQDWNTLVERMFVEKEGFQALCKKCHHEITISERFKTTPEEAKILIKAIQFSKQPSAKQVVALTQLGCPKDLTSNSKTRRAAYIHYLNHGKFPDT